MLLVVNMVPMATENLHLFKVKSEVWLSVEMQGLALHTHKCVLCLLFLISQQKRTKAFFSIAFWCWGGQLGVVSGKM